MLNARSARCWATGKSARRWPNSVPPRDSALFLLTAILKFGGALLLSFRAPFSRLYLAPPKMVRRRPPLMVLSPIICCKYHVYERYRDIAGIGVTTLGETARSPGGRSAAAGPVRTAGFGRGPGQSARAGLSRKFPARRRRATGRRSEACYAAIRIAAAECNQTQSPGRALRMRGLAGPG